MEGTREAATASSKCLLREPHRACPVRKAGIKFSEELGVYSSHTSCVWLTRERLGDAVSEAQSTSAGESELDMGHITSVILSQSAGQEKACDPRELRAATPHLIGGRTKEEAEDGQMLQGTSLWQGQIQLQKNSLAGGRTPIKPELPLCLIILTPCLFFTTS